MPKPPKSPEMEKPAWAKTLLCVAIGQECTGDARAGNGLSDDAGLCLYYRAVDCYI
jgi:hypothetical protein